MCPAERGSIVPSQEELRQRGQELRRKIFGPPSPGQKKSPTAILAPDLARISDEVLMAQIWSRPGLELQQRSLITIAALTALGREPELRAHIRGGLNLGLTREQIVEAIMQMAFYAGQPAAHAGFRAAHAVFTEIDQAEEES